MSDDAVYTFVLALVTFVWPLWRIAWALEKLVALAKGVGR